MEELDLKELFMIFWNKKTEIILIVLMIAILGVVYSYVAIEPKYSSSTTLVLATSQTGESENSITQTDVTLNSKLISTYSELIKSKSVLRKVIENLNTDKITERNLRNNITVRAVQNTEIIKITVSNTDPNIAAQVANEVAKAFINKNEEIYGIKNVYVVDSAEPNSMPSNINHAKDITLFAVVGLIIAVIYALIVNVLDTTIKTEEDVEKIENLLVLASIPLYDNDKKKGGKKRK